jgi:hypothetical protein
LLFSPCAACLPLAGELADQALASAVQTLDSFREPQQPMAAQIVCLSIQQFRRTKTGPP